MKKIYLATALGLFASSSAFAGANLNAGYQLNSLEQIGGVRTQVATVGVDYTFAIYPNLRVAPGITAGMGTVANSQDIDKAKKTALETKVKYMTEAYVRIEGDVTNKIYLFTAPKYTFSAVEMNTTTDGKVAIGAKAPKAPKAPKATEQNLIGINVGAGYKFTKNVSAEVKYGMSKMHFSDKDDKSVATKKYAQDAIALNVRYSF